MEEGGRFDIICRLPQSTLILLMLSGDMVTFRLNLVVTERAHNWWN